MAVVVRRALVFIYIEQREQERLRLLVGEKLLGSLE
jgi:hypothetical protein